jgi:hypothetical protein
MNLKKLVTCKVSYERKVSYESKKTSPKSICSIYGLL